MNNPLIRDGFFLLAAIYFTIGIVDKFRWWNGSDENGDPK